MLNKMILFAAAVVMSAVLAPSEAKAYGAAHVGYTHVGPNGVQHYGATAVSRPGGTYGGYRATGVSAGGGAYSAGYRGVSGGGGAVGGYHYDYRYSGGAAAGGGYRYGYVR